MNKWVIMIVGFFFVILIGVGVIFVSEKTDEEVAADISLYSGIRLTQHGQKICQQEIKKVLKKTIYSPNSSDGDRMSTVTLKWKGRSKDYQNISCTYNIDQGVTSLIIDDQVIIEK